jgi:hypothetical protein
MHEEWRCAIHGIRGIIPTVILSQLVGAFLEGMRAAWKESTQAARACTYTYTTYQLSASEPPPPVVFRLAVASIHHPLQPQVSS